MLRLGATQVKQVAHRAPNENPSRAPAMPDATPQVVYMTCRAFMRRSADLTGGRRASLRSSARTCARRRTMSSIRRPRLSSLLSPSHHLSFPRRLRLARIDCPRVCTSPRTRGGWSAESAHWSSCHAARRDIRVSDTRRVPLRPGRASRRSTVAIFGRGTHAAVSGSGGRIRPATCPRPGHTAWRTGSRTSRGSGSRRRRGTPLPAPPAGSSPETPLMSEDANLM